MHFNPMLFGSQLYFYLCVKDVSVIFAYSKHVYLYSVSFSPSPSATHLPTNCIFLRSA